MPFAQMLFLLASLSVFYPAAAQSESGQPIRIATFNIAMGLKTQGDLFARLQSGEDNTLQKVAAVIQQVRPDVLLLNEFDWSEQNSAALFVSNYLESSLFGNEAISYTYKLTDAVNRPTRVWPIRESRMHLEGFAFVPGRPNQIWHAQGEQVDRYELEGLDGPDRQESER